MKGKKDIQSLRMANIENTKRKLTLNDADNDIKRFLRQGNDAELERALKEYVPRICNITGYFLAAKLISEAGSLKKLAFMPSSKIQLLGAERSFFLHLKSGSKMPKHGLIAEHDSVIASKDKGKSAKQLAAKIMIAARQDYFSASKK